MRKYLALFSGSVLAGISISIGGTVFLANDNKILGSLFFAIGLLIIVTRGFALFTGRVGYAVENKPVYIVDLIIIWIGNLIGTAGIGYILRQTRIFTEKLDEKVTGICEAKLNDGLLSIFILAFLCGILMFVAVDGYKNNKTDIAKHLLLVLCVSVFIISGFEHCIANMYYFSIANMWSAKTLGYLLIMTFGNAAGGMFFPLLKKLDATIKQL